MAAVQSPRIPRLLLLLTLLLGACAAPQAPAAPAATARPAATAAPAASAPAAAQPTAGPAARQPLSPKVTVRYGQLGQASDAGVYLAIDRGYFAAEGLELEMTQIDGGGRMVPGLGAGQIDVGGGGISSALINALARDVPLRLIADKGSLRPGFGYQAILVRKELMDRGVVQGVADLRGRRVALNSLNSVDIYALAAALQQAGLRLEDVHTEEIPYPDMIAALTNGAVDAAVALEPTVTAAVQRDIATRLLTSDQTVPNLQLGTIMYAPNFMRDQPEAGRRFMLAYLRGVRDYNRAFTTGEGKDEAIKTLTEYSTIKNPRVFEEMILPGVNPNGHINTASISAAQEFWLRLGLMSAVVPPEQFVDHSYLDWALGILGRVPE